MLVICHINQKNSINEVQVMYIYKHIHTHTGIEIGSDRQIVTSVATRH